MYLTRTSAPAETPISVAELKTHLRISHSVEDTPLALLVQAVTDELDGPDGFIRRALVTQTWTLTARCFPEARPDGRTIWRLPMPPLQSVSSIAYYDSNNDAQTFSSANYTVHIPPKSQGYIELSGSVAWPAVYDRDDAVTITFIAGYGAATDVPAQLRQAMLVLAASLYTNRGDMVTERGVDPAILSRLIGQYRWPELA